MKTRLGVLIFVFLTGMILGVVQPAFLYGSETPAGNPWDPFVNVSLFTGQPIKSNAGTKLDGPLSIVLNTSIPITLCGNGLPYATMLYTVRLGKGSQMYWFDGETPNVCEGNIGTPGSGGQGDAVMSFLKSVVLFIFPNAKDAKVISLDNAGPTPDALAFIADITIAVTQ